MIFKKLAPIISAAVATGRLADELGWAARNLHEKAYGKSASEVVRDEFKAELERLSGKKTDRSKAIEICKLAATLAGRWPSEVDRALASADLDARSSNFIRHNANYGVKIASEEFRPSVRLRRCEKEAEAKLDWEDKDTNSTGSGRDTDTGSNRHSPSKD